jgi:hypothetical protein
VGAENFAPRRGIRAEFEPFEEQLGRPAAHLLLRLIHGGEGDGQMFDQTEVVESDNGELRRDFDL